MLRGVESYPGKLYFSVNKRVFYLLFALLLILVVFMAVSFFVKLYKINAESTINSCGDGTFYGSCSLDKPYFCNEGGVLIPDSGSCGCPENSSKVNGQCAYILSSSPKEISLRYILNGNEGEISFIVYGGVNDYLSGLPQSIRYSGNEISSRADFKINKIDEEAQKRFLMPLVAEIRNLAPNDNDNQARIAVSLVQNIPYGESDKLYNFAGQEVSYSRYPYQVLYDYEGICGEKTELLAFLLRELGYGVSFFYYEEENHEALGIKCPVYESFSGTGYCFVETTAPSIIGDDTINYADLGKLQSNPEVFFISEGFIFGQDNFYEYKDSKKVKSIRNFIEKHGWIGHLNKKRHSLLKNRYGLVDEYYGG